MFSVQKIMAFVFDNVDVIANQHGTECISNIFKKFCSRSASHGGEATKVIVTSRTWHPLLKKMVVRLNNPVLMIGNFMEAALYGNLRICLEIKREEEKMKALKGKMEALGT